jgi:hypothetical protein
MPKGVKEWGIPSVIYYSEPNVHYQSKGGGTVRVRIGGWSVTVYLWGPLVLCSVHLAIASIRAPYARYRRRKKGLCLACGYNLEGNVSGVCPECGCATKA